MRCVCVMGGVGEGLEGVDTPPIAPLIVQVT